MGNILFQNNPKPNNNAALNVYGQLKQAGPSQVLFNQMYMNNPAFKRFADNLRDVSPEQAFSQFGQNFNDFKNLKW